MAGMYGCFKSRNSDSGSMASGPPDVMTNQEPAEVAEECSGKKKSKFQTFKKFFTRKKRKEPPAAAAAAAAADAGLKASQSSDNVSKTSDNNTLTRSEKEKGSGSKISLGSKALSHDSVFVSDSSEANEALGASQDSIHGKVKSLQLQLKQAIKLGSPPSLMCVKRTDDAGTMSEDDGLPCSPPEYTTLHSAMNQVERNSSVSLEGMDSDDDQLSCAAPSRAMSPLVVPGDFSQPASPFGCLDNSAAKHKLGLRHKACNKRKPVARLEMKAEGDSMTLNSSVTEASEEKDQQKTTTEVADELTAKVEVEEEERKEEEEDEEEESQHATQSLLRDKEQREEGEDEPEAGQDVSQGLDTSCPTESCPSEEEVPDVQPPSSRASSGASSLDSPRNTPEPPAGQREHLLDPPAVAWEEEEEEAAEGDSLPITEEVGVQEESSFLQEVLSSLKTPLAPSPSAGEAVADDLEVEEVKEGEAVEAEEVEEEEEEEEEAEVEEPVSNQVLPAESLPSHQTTKEEEEVSAFRSTCQDDEDEGEEHKVEDEEEEAAAAAEEEEEEEELMVEQICPHSEKEEEEKGEEEEVTTEHQNDLLTENPVVQEDGRGDEESEAEEEEAVVEKLEEEVEEAEEAAEALMDVAEEMMQPKAAAEDVDVAVTLQDEGDEDDAVKAPESRDEAEIPAELLDQVMESQAASSPSCEEQEEEEEERMEEDEDQREHKSDQEEDDGVNQADEDQTESDVEREAAEESHSDVERVEKDPLEATEEAPVPSKPSPLSLPESHDVAPPLESAPITPSKTSTTTLHINLVSPSSEKVPSFFQQSPNVDHPKDIETLSGAEEATEQNTISAAEEEEKVDAVEAVEEEKQLVPEEQEEEEKETPSPASVEEAVHQSSSGSAQSKVRFTVAPAWQRSLSAEDAKDTASPPSSPPASSVSSPSSAIAGPEDDAAESEEPASSAEGEQVFVSDRVRSAKAPAAKPQRSPASPLSPVRTPTSANTEESSVIVEGNPFGVRLRKTSGLYRFSSEEENTEPHMEPPAQASSSKVDSPQPVSVKPSVSQPASAKPALPKKPDVHGDGAGKSRRISDPAAGRGVSGGSDSPSWISVAKQKQKIYKENSLEEITVKKEEQERKSSLPMYVSSAVNREHGGKTAAESSGKVSLAESSKSSVSAEKEPRRSLSPPTPVPAQTPKTQSFPSPVPPKPQPPPATSKPPPHKSTSPPTPVPVPQKPSSCTSPPPPSKPAASANAPHPQSSTVTSPPFSPRAASEKPVLRAPGLSSQTPSSQRSGPPPALPQDEPPWMALAKKKAKAWSEMPQIAPV